MQVKVDNATFALSLVGLLRFVHLLIPFIYSSYYPKKLAPRIFVAWRRGQRHDLPLYPYLGVLLTIDFKANSLQFLAYFAIYALEI